MSGAATITPSDRDALLGAPSTLGFHPSAAVAASVAYRAGVPASDLLAEVATSAARDALLVRLMRRPSAAVPDLIAAVQSTPNSDPRAAQLAAVLAFVAYRTGDGALAQVAIDRALRVTPDHRLAMLLMGSIGMGVTPDELDEMTEGL